jgi:hypothetical protein
MISKLLVKNKFFARAFVQASAPTTAGPAYPARFFGAKKRKGKKFSDSELTTQEE